MRQPLLLTPPIAAGCQVRCADCKLYGQARQLSEKKKEFSASRKEVLKAKHASERYTVKIRPWLPWRTKRRGLRTKRRGLSINGTLYWSGTELSCITPRLPSRKWTRKRQVPKSS